MIRTVLVVTLTFLYIFLVGPPALLIAYLIRSARPLYSAGKLGTRVAMRLGGMTLEVNGRERIDVRKPCIYVPNHESLLDPVVVLGRVPHNAAALAKKEFFRLPILGRVCRVCGFIPVDRQNPERRMQAVNDAVRMITEKRQSYVVFGEGTRSRDGRLGPFKKGAAIMAISAHVDMIPVVVHGGHALWPKGRLFFRPGHVRLEFLDPLPTLGMTMLDKERLTDECRSRILERLRDIDPDYPGDVLDAVSGPHPGDQNG